MVGNAVENFRTLLPSSPGPLMGMPNEATAAIRRTAGEKI